MGWALAQLSAQACCRSGSGRHQRRQSLRTSRLGSRSTRSGRTWTPRVCRSRCRRHRTSTTTCGTIQCPVRVKQKAAVEGKEMLWDRFSGRFALYRCKLNAGRSRCLRPARPRRSITRRAAQRTQGQLRDGGKMPLRLASGGWLAFSVRLTSRPYWRPKKALPAHSASQSCKNKGGNHTHTTERRGGQRRGRAASDFHGPNPRKL